MTKKKCKIIDLNETLELCDNSINLEEHKISFAERFYQYKKEINEAIENHHTEQLKQKIKEVEKSTFYIIQLQIYILKLQKNEQYFY